MPPRACRGHTVRGVESRSSASAEEKVTAPATGPSSLRAKQTPNHGTHWPGECYPASQFLSRNRLTLMVASHCKGVHAMTYARCSGEVEVDLSHCSHCGAARDGDTSKALPPPQLERSVTDRQMWPGCVVGWAPTCVSMSDWSGWSGSCSPVSGPSSPECSCMWRGCAVRWLNTSTSFPPWSVCCGRS